MIPELREDGYLPTGIHQASLMDIKKRFVKTGHQKKLWRNFNCWLDEVMLCLTSQKLWISGSFLSRERSANDIDVVVWIDTTQHIDVERLVSLQTHNDAYKHITNENGQGDFTPLPRIQPGNGRVDAFYAAAGNVDKETYWSEVWSTIFDKKTLRTLGTKGFLEVRL